MRSCQELRDEKADTLLSCLNPGCDMQLNSKPPETTNPFTLCPDRHHSVNFVCLECLLPRLKAQYDPSEPHLLGALALHLRGAGCRSPEHAGGDADGQVEGVHLVVVGVALDTVQHSDDMS